jgi:hypothetical protein
MNICKGRSLQIDISLRLLNASYTVLKTGQTPVDFPKNSHYTGYRVPAYASVFFNFPIGFLKGTLLFCVPFTIFLKRRMNMDSGMIGKIDKAKRYAQEPHRFCFEAFTVKIDGENNSHVVKFANNKWDCDCDYFRSRGVCTHTLTLTNYILKGMVPVPVEAG